MKITALSLVLAALTVAALLGCRSQSTPTVAPTPTPVPTPRLLPTQTPTGEPTATPLPPTIPPRQAAGIRLEVPAPSVTPGQEFTITVWLEPAGRGISGAQFDLTYLAVVEVVAATPGPLLGADPVTFEKPGDEPGTYRYAAARVGPTAGPTSAGAVATLRLRLSPQAAPGSIIALELGNVLLADGDLHRVDDVAVGPAAQLTVTIS